MKNLVEVTSESVGEGHPDKFCDQVSDAVLDDVLKHDPTARVACEVAAFNGLVVVGGEISTDHYVNLNDPDEGIVPNLIRKIGYTKLGLGLNPEVSVLNSIIKQSPYIAEAVIEKDERGAGDQGHMWGYAIRETDTLMPLGLHLAHQLVLKTTEVRHQGVVPHLRPDLKSQVTLRYDRDTKKPVNIATIVISPQHNPDISLDDLRDGLHTHVIDPVFEGLDRSNTEYNIETEGTFVLGGPGADTGLTGRKIVVDTYGGGSAFYGARHGGGAFSGKDPTKVDRSAAYMARNIAKNVVAAHIAYVCEVELAYEFGKTEPSSVYVNTFGTGEVEDQRIEKAVRDVFRLRPAQIIEDLDLIRPIYAQTAVGGHFGRELPDFTWEKTDKVDDLRTALHL